MLASGPGGREPPPRFIVSPTDIVDDVLYLRGEEGHHARNVLRLRRGDGLVAIDGTGGEYEATVQVHTADGLIARVTKRRRRSNEPLTRLTLAQGVTRNAKLTLVVGQAVPLGVSEVLLVSCARSAAEVTENELRHLNAVATAATKQALRAVVPPVTGPVSWQEAIKRGGRQDLRFICLPSDRAAPLATAVASKPRRGLNVIILAGPEGGFEPREIEEAEAAGFRALDLGPRRLRSELAATAACALVLHAAGDLGPTPLERGKL